MMRGLVGLASVAMLTGCATAPAKREAAAQPSGPLMELARVVPQHAGMVVVIPRPDEAREGMAKLGDARTSALGEGPLGAMLFGPQRAAELEGPLLGVVGLDITKVYISRVRDASAMQARLRASFPAAVELPGSTAASPLWGDEDIAWRQRDGFIWLAAQGGEQTLQRTCLPCRPRGGWSLADDEGWQRLLMRGEQALLTAYVPAGSDVFRQVTDDARQAPAAARLLGAAHGGALTLSASPPSARLWVSLDAWGAKRAAQLSTSAGARLQDSIPSDAAAYARLGVDALSAWRQLVEFLNDGAGTELDLELERLTALLGVEPSIERALLAGLTGDVLVVLTPGAGDSIFDLGDHQLSMLIALRDTTSAATLTKQLADGARSKGVTVSEREAGGARRWQVDDGGVLPAIYVRGARMLFAPPSMSDAAALAMLDGAHRGATRAGLSARGLTEGTSSLYMSAAAAKTLMRWEPALQAETLLTLEVGAGGLELRATYGEPAPILRGLSSRLLALGHEPHAQAKREALGVVSALAYGAASYFESEQRYSGPGGGQPWHAAQQEPSKAAGIPVPWVSYVFPGGDGFTWTSLDRIPRGGERLPARLGSSEIERATLERLGYGWSEPKHFRYTYEASGRGGSAQVVIRAEADLKPETPQVHTVEVRVYVDPATQEVVIAPSFTTNDGE